MHKAPRIDPASIAACVILIVIGIAAISVTEDFSPLGSVFPRTISALMIFLSGLYLALAWLNPRPVPTREAGSNIRRAAVAFIMVAWAFALVPVGFLLSSAVAFVMLLVIAHYGNWTPRISMLYACGAVLLLVSLYLLFKVALQVPLPQGIFL